MKSSWLKVLIIVSLGLNCMIAGALAYRFLSGKPLGPFSGGAPPESRNPAFTSLPAGNIADHELLRQKMSAVRRQMVDARGALIGLLAAPEPDRRQIDGHLDRINEMHAAMERMAVEQMLEDIQSLPPDKRADFIKNVRQSRYCRWEDGHRHGHGRGRGGEGRGRDGRGGRQRSKQFPP